MFIDRNYERAKSLLTENIDILHSMSEALMKYETLDSDQLDQLMARQPVSEPKDWENDDQSGSGKATIEDKDATDKESKPTIGGPAEQP